MDHHTCSKCYVTVLVPILLIARNLAYALSLEGPEKVIIKPITHIRHIDVPTSDEPVKSWMEIRKGFFPFTTPIMTNLTVGDPITIFVFLKDENNFYDIKVTGCWAYDDQDIEIAKNNLNLFEGRPNSKTKIIGEWNKYNYLPGEELRTFLYTNLKAFKFPDKNQVYLTCDVELCFKVCDKELKKNSL